jgi:hypothetical protein
MYESGLICLTDVTLKAHAEASPVRDYDGHWWLREVSRAPACKHREGVMVSSRNPRLDVYDPKTLAVMDQAFAAIWYDVRADDPFRDYANDSELRIAIGRKLLNLVADGVTDPNRLRHLTIESLLLPGH